jgi:hypothetical protein
VTEFTGLPQAPKFDKKMHRVRQDGSDGMVVLARAEGVTTDGPWVIRYFVLWDCGAFNWYDEWELEDIDDRRE